MGRFAVASLPTSEVQVSMLFRIVLANEALLAVLSTMEKTDKVPEGPVEVGKEKPDGDGAEVAGRSKQLLFTCFNDGAGNYISPGAEWYTCWKCGTLYNLKTSESTPRSWP